MKLGTVHNRGHGLEGFIGESRAVDEVRTVLARIAPSVSPVLILGESGTGKDIVARAIHDASPRCDGPYIAENCAALPEALLESEMFGYERGAFSGAVQAKKGLFEAAAGGTLFLDEIAETSLEVQAKLLRALESGEIRRLGDISMRPVDTRIVAATSCDLMQAVDEGVFRPELFYRLNVLSLRLPPLRERREDIPLLARHFLDHCSQAMDKRVVDFAPAVMDALVRYDWPGNVRQLRNEIERMAVLADDGGVIDGRLLSEYLQPPKPAEQDESLSLALRRIKRELIEDALRRSSGNRTHAAKRLGISRSNLQHSMSRLGIE